MIKIKSHFDERFIILYEIVKLTFMLTLVLSIADLVNAQIPEEILPCKIKVTINQTSCNRIIGDQFNEFVFPQVKIVQIQGYSCRLYFLKRPILDFDSKLGIKIPIYYEIVETDVKDSVILFAPFKNETIQWEKVIDLANEINQGVYIKLSKENLISSLERYNLQNPIKAALLDYINEFSDKEYKILDAGIANEFLKDKSDQSAIYFSPDLAIDPNESALDFVLYPNIHVRRNGYSIWFGSKLVPGTSSQYIFQFSVFSHNKFKVVDSWVKFSNTFLLKTVHNIDSWKFLEQYAEVDTQTSI